MKPKTPIKFESFADGVCSIWDVKGNRLECPKFSGVPFGDRVVGSRRYYAARAAATKINRVIHIPVLSGIHELQNVVIAGDRYRIEQLQRIGDANPPVTVLTLCRIGTVSGSDCYE